MAPVLTGLVRACCAVLDEPFVLAAAWELKRWPWIPGWGGAAVVDGLGRRRLCCWRNVRITRRRLVLHANLCRNRRGFALVLSQVVCKCVNQ